MMAEPGTTMNYSQSRFLNLTRSFDDSGYGGSMHVPVNYEFL